MRAFKTYSVNNFQIYNTVLLAIVTMLYITSPGLIYLITGSLYILTTLTHFSHFHCPPLSIWQLLSVLYEFGVFFFYKHSYVSKIIQYLSFFDLLHPVFLILEGNMVNNHLLTYLPWWVPGQTVPTSDIFMILKQLYWASWRDLRQGFLTKRASSVQVKFAAR